MTTIELKELLLKEHKRDKKLTYLSLFLLLGALLIIVALLYHFAYDILMDLTSNTPRAVENIADSGNSPLFQKIIIASVFLFLIISRINVFVKIWNRPKKIEEFISKIDSGMIASNIDERIVHRLKLPLILIKLNLIPINFFTITLDTELKAYDLPLNLSYMPKLKVLLSGVNSKNVNKLWHELYDDVEKNENYKDYELKSVNEFSDFLQNNLLNQIKDSDLSREKAKSTQNKYLIIAGVFIALIVVLAVSINALNLEIKPEYYFYGIIALFVPYYIYVLIKKKTSGQSMVMESSNSFKLKIFKPIVEFINPNFQFILHGHITADEFLETGFFREYHYDIRGNDQIIGNHKGVPFQLSDLDVERTKNFSKEKDGPAQVFYGQVFIAKFNKTFNSELYLVPKIKKSIKTQAKGLVADALVGAAGRKLTYKGEDIKSYFNYSLGEKVVLEDPEFMELFEVYCDNQVEARYILSASIMDKLKKIRSTADQELYISFKNDRISFLNNSGRDNFEPGYFKSLGANNNQLLLGYYNELCDQLSIIEELKLNINIWNKK